MKSVFGIIISIGFILLLSCGKKENKTGNVLLSYQGKALTFEEVIDRIPEGISPLDSAAMFTKIVDGWVRDMVLTELAEDRLYDMDAIERRVRDYRNSLIVSEYLNRMRETHTPEINEIRVKEYYDKHRRELKLEVPLLKGVFLKINSEAKGKEAIPNLLSSEDPSKIDELESEWLDRAIEYHYFRDKWIDWETVAGWIPQRFGNPDELLKNKYFETKHNEYSYYLQITDYLPSGEEQPYEFASQWIKELLTQGDLVEFEKALVESIVKKSIQDKKLETIGYNPLTHEIKENYVKVEDEK